MAHYQYGPVSNSVNIPSNYLPIPNLANIDVPAGANRVTISISGTISGPLGKAKIRLYKGGVGQDFHDLGGGQSADWTVSPGDTVTAMWESQSSGTNTLESQGVVSMDIGAA